jgi:hypothetical protein
MLGLAGGSELGASRRGLRNCLRCGPNHTSDNVSHGPATVGAKDFDSDDVRSFGNPISAGGNSTGTMSSVAVTVLINVIGRDSLAPRGTAFELLVVDVDAGVDNIDIDTFTSIRIVNILRERTKTELRSVADAGKTLILTCRQIGCA